MNARVNVSHVALVLQLTGDQSKLYPASHDGWDRLQHSCDPELDVEKYWMDGWMVNERLNSHGSWQHGRNMVKN